MIEHVGTTPTQYKVVTFGGGEAGLYDLRAGDTLVWDGRSDRPSVRRDRPPVPTAKDQIMDVARERGPLHDVTLRGLGADQDAAARCLTDVTRTIVGLVSQGLIELRETPDGDWDTGRPLTGRELQAALADPAAPIGSPESMRIIRLSLTPQAVAAHPAVTPRPAQGPMGRLSPRRSET